MENTSQASSNVSGQIFLSPLPNVNLSKQPMAVEHPLTVQDAIHVDGAGGSQAVTLVQITDGEASEGQVPQLYQLVPQAFETQQQSYVPSQSIQNTQTTTSGTLALSQLSSAVPLTVSNGAMTVFESNGQHYLIVPNFSNIAGQNDEQLLIRQNVVAGDVTLPQENQGIILTGSHVAQTQATVNQTTTSSLTAVVEPPMTSMNNKISENSVPQASSQTRINSTAQAAVRLPPSVLKFHSLSSDGTTKETTTVASQLHMLDIIPSFFQRTVHQQAEMSSSCRFCKFTATSRQEMKKHLEEHKKDESLLKKAKLWKPKKQSKKKKAQMIRTPTPKTDKPTFPPKCPACQADLKNAAQYRKHLKLHKGEKPHRCKECGESFNKEHNLNLHKSLHQSLDLATGAEKHRCPVCERGFTRLAGLKMHISLHAEEENYICKECGDEFSSDEDLTRHIAEHSIDVARLLHDKQKVAAGIPTDLNPSSGTIEITVDATPEFLQQEMQTKTPVISKRRPRGSGSSKTYGLSHYCQQCGKSFQKKSQLNRHLLIHTGERPHKCDICEKAFNQKSALQQHLSVHSGEKKFSCPHCPQTYRQRGNLNLHIRRVHDVSEMEKKKFACQYCPCIFKKIGSLNSHVTKYHKQLSLTESQIISVEHEKVQEEQQAQVDDLENIFCFYNNDAINNVEGASENQQFPADIVDQALNECVKNSDTDKEVANVLADFNAANSSINPEALLMEFQPTQTEAVDQSSDLIALLADEATSGNGQADFSSATSQPSTAVTQTPIVNTPDLQIVNDWSYTGVNKTNNWRTKLRDGLRYHECLFCNKEFRKPSDLQRHIRIHTLEKPFKCKQCSKEFTVKSSLTAHIRTHLGIKPYRCPVCHKSFTTGGALRIHNRVHTGAKPFPCPHCDKKFRTSSQRSNHVCLHYRCNTKKPKPRTSKKKPEDYFSNLKMLPPMVCTASGNLKLTKRPEDDDSSSQKKFHKCQQCGKHFKRFRTLQLHMKLHSDDKPYKCGQCTKRFVALMYLKAHIKMHEGLNKFVCDICGHKFSTKGSLKRHASKHSNERPYLCPYCKKSFKAYDSCSKHIKSHRDEVASMMLSASSAHHPVFSIPISASSSSVSNEATVMPGSNITEEHGDFTNEFSPAGEVIANSFMHNLPSTDDNAETAAMEQVNPNMVQNIMNLAPEQTTQPQSQGDLTTTIPHNSGNESSLQQESQTNADLDYLTSLSVSGSSNILMNQVQNQEALQFFEFNLADSMDTANAEQPLYVDSLNLLTNIPAPSTDLTQPPVAVIPVIAEGSNTLNTRKRRSKFHGGTEVQYGDQVLYQCTGCETIFSKEEFLDHTKGLSAMLREFSFLCEFCCHRFPLATHHQSHSSFHKVETGLVYKCEQCGVGFTDSAVRDEHRSRFCQQVERSSPTNTKKVINAPSANENPYTAAKSRPSFIRFTDDQNKILSMTNPNLHMTVSERILLSAVAEKDKIIETVNEKRGRFKALETDGPKHKYVCQHCPKSFYKQCDLVRHTRTHTGEKPFKCKTCGRRFSVKSCMVAHEKIHLGVKEFRCHICNTMYSSKASLKVHMRLHTGGLPFKCPHCEERFRTSGHRKCHIATHFTSKSKKTTKKDSTPPSLPQPDQSNVIVTDLSFMLPEGVLQGNEPVQLQWNGQNLQVISDSNKFGENMTLQIDPAALQQAINNSAASQDVIRSYTRPTATSPAPNLVIQPITLPESVMRDQTGMQEVNVAVPANLAPFTQMFFQAQPVSNNQESTLSQPMTEDPKDAKLQDSGQKEVTLVLTPEELASQGIVPESTMQHFTLDLLSSEDMQSSGQQSYQ